MASDFPLGYYTGTERGPMNELFKPDGAATFGVQQLVFFNTSDQEIELCGADPALILGISKGAVADKFLWAEFGTGTGRVPVSIITPAVEYGMCVGSGTLTAAHQGNSYGIQRLASGNWAIDLTDTTNLRVTVIKVDTTNQIAWVKFIAANLQFDAIAS